MNKPRAHTLVIGITGTMTSGKAALRYFLASRGFESIRHTEPILKYGLKQKVDMSNRDKWLEVLVQLRKEQGLDTLAKQVSKSLKQGKRYIIGPIRHPADILLLKKQFNVLMIFVDASSNIRYRRTLLKEQGSNLSKKEFRERDKFEYTPTGKDAEYLPNINECKKLSDEIILNESSLNELNEKLEKILRKHKIANLVTIDDGFDT